MNGVSHNKVKQVIERFEGYEDAQAKIYLLDRLGILISSTRLKTLLEYPIEVLLEVLQENNNVIISTLLYQDKNGRDLSFVEQLLSMGFSKLDLLSKIYSFGVIREKGKYCPALKILTEDDKKWHKIIFKHTQEVMKKMTPMYDDREASAIYSGSYITVNFLKCLGFYKTENNLIKQQIASFYMDVIAEADCNAIFLLQNMKPNDDIKVIEEYRNYIMQNKREFIELLKNNSDLPIYMYNNFSMLKRSARSSKGSGRQLKLTFGMARRVLVKNIKVKKGYENLAQFIITYYGTKENLQELLDSAIKILEEQKELNIEEHLLGESFSSEDFISKNPFAKTEQNIQKMIGISADTLKELTDVANSEFSFEWVSKHSEINFVLGRLCDCCSHLDGAGRGIVYQTFVNPAVQTLAIKNKKGDIVAKSTAYLNRAEGYAVFNNIEVANIVAEEDKDKIYIKFKLAVKAFAEKYNSKNTNVPLKKISIGARKNDLITHIDADKTNKILEDENLLSSIVFYDDRTGGYNGDSDTLQYSIWER